MKYDDGSSNKIAVASDGQASITNDDEPGVQVSGRLEPQTGSNSSSWQFNIVDQQVTTKMTDFLAAGATRIEVSSSVGFEVGSEVVIDGGSSVEEINKIKGFGSILLQTPTEFDHKAGATVSASSNGELYRLKIQDGVLVVSRFAESTWVAGSGTLAVSETETSEFSIEAIMIVAAGIGLLAVAMASALFCMYCRRRKNIAPTSSVHVKDQVSTNPDMGTPKLLGGSCLTNPKKSRDTFEASPRGAEVSDLEIAFETGQKQNLSSDIETTNDRGDEEIRLEEIYPSDNVCSAWSGMCHVSQKKGDEITGRLSKRDIEAVSEDNSMSDNTFDFPVQSI
jgi:hypothetical protein